MEFIFAWAVLSTPASTAALVHQVAVDLPLASLVAAAVVGFRAVAHQVDGKPWPIPL